MIKTCEVCGKNFQVEEKIKFQKYCSEECSKVGAAKRNKLSYEKRKYEKQCSSVDRLQQDAAGAREAGMSYGQYMLKKQSAAGRNKNRCSRTGRI